MGTMQPVPAPRVALFNTNTTYQWTDATRFNGFVLIQLVPPSNGTTQWAEAVYGNLYPSIALPVFQRVPIIDGTINGSCGLFLTTDITPPDSNYIAWYYDATGRQIAGPTTTFTVTNQDAFTPPLLPLPNPTTPGTPVQPDVAVNQISV